MSVYVGRFGTMNPWALESAGVRKADKRDIPEVVAWLRDREGVEEQQHCSTHQALAHPPSDESELRCDVWVVAHLDGWDTSQPCRISPRLIVPL